MELLLNGIDASGDLLQILVDQGARTTVEVALIDEDIAGVLIETRPDLATDLRAAVSRARPSVDGWVRAVTVFGGSGGGEPAGGTVKTVTPRASPEVAPPPGPEER